MIFQRKIDRALKKLHEESDHPETDHFRNDGSAEEEGEKRQPEGMDLEKNDFLAMLIAAFLTFLPAALVVLGGISLIGYFFLMHGG